MEEVEEEEATISLQRALADIEILFSAYPDEVRMVETSDEDISTTIVPDDSSIRRHEQHQQEQKQNHPEQNHNQHFPLYIIFQLSSTAILKLQFETGYPISSNITVVSYRCHPRETSCMEAIVTAIQNTSMECLENEMEGGLACCAVAKDLWDSYNTTSSAINNIANANEIVVDGGDGGEGGVGRILQPFVDFEHQQDEQDNDQKYNWISSATIIEKKSIFQSHVCSVRSEDDVPMALQQLKYKNTRIQRATHNMVRIVFVYVRLAPCTTQHMLRTILVEE